ncbi:PEP-CTERM sorting domain-containing protein [Sedimentisphaera cyanobacteriorum]
MSNYYCSKTGERHKSVPEPSTLVLIGIGIWGFIKRDN